MAILLGLHAGLTAAGEHPFGGTERFLRHVSHLQRFEALRASRTDDPPIRVLVYGQSITAQSWANRLVEALRAGAPHREWRTENRSIGGHTAEYLRRTAEADLFPFHPDLVIFHAYGDTNAYAQLVLEMRRRTCADIVLVGNHYAVWDDPNGVGIGTWDGVMLPELAAIAGACHADVRTPWKEHLLSNQLSPSSLLLDTVHLNPDGDRLMGELVGRHFIGPRLQPAMAPYASGRSRRVGLPSGEPDGARIPFRGSRVVGRVDRTRVGTAQVRVDGQPPSVLPGGAFHGRSSPWSGTSWPALLAVGYESVPTPEEWTLTIEEVLQPGEVTFRVEGSVTGHDGMGTSLERFRSTSGRVVLEPSDWYWARLGSPLNTGFKIRWTTQSTGVDTIASDGGGQGTGWVDLVAGLPPGEHVLELSTVSGVLPVDELIVYNPLASDLDPVPEAVATLHWLTGTTGTLVVGSATVPWSRSTDLRHWEPFRPGSTAGRAAVWLDHADPAVFLSTGTD